MEDNRYNPLFFRIKIRHDNCWTSLIPQYYRDIMIGYFYSNDILRAIRVSTHFNKNCMQSLKNDIKMDKSVKNVKIYNMDNISSIIEMNVDYENAFLDKLVKNSIFPLKTSVENNYENYIFTANTNIKKLLSGFKDIKIMSIAELKYNMVISELSHSVIDIFLTERQRNILRLSINNNFFNVPRGTSNELMAEQLSISRMAFNLEIRKTVNKIINKMYN